MIPSKEERLLDLVLKDRESNEYQVTREMSYLTKEKAKVILIHELEKMIEKIFRD